jgi:hypothetical protein
MAATFLSSALAQEPTNQASANSAPPSTHQLKVVVDPRVELMSVIFRLAGNREYNQPRVESYAADADKQFGKFSDHEAVQMARELRNSQGVSYDAVASMAVHLTGVEDIKLKVPLNPWPDGLDKRWLQSDLDNFLAAAGRFVKDSSFHNFLDAHRPLYETTVSRMQALIDKDARLEWFDAYFGPRRNASFTVALGLLNGGSCYGPHFRSADGAEELYCILGVWQADTQGLPEFQRDALPTVVHEFCHSYANPLVDHHLAA